MNLPKDGRDVKTARIRELNDAFRKTFAGGKVVMTESVAALPDMVTAHALVCAATIKMREQRQSG